MIDAAIYSGFARILAEKLILLKDRTLEDTMIDPEQEDENRASTK